MSEEKRDPIRGAGGGGDGDDDDENIPGDDVEVIEVNADQLGEDELVDNLADVGMDQDEEDEDEDEDDGDLDEPIQTIEKHKGGEDDLAFVFKYDPSNPSKQVECELETEKFTDSVTQVRFNHDAKLVAMCDMSGRLRVYSGKSMLWSYEIDTDVEHMQWHAQANVLFCSTADGYFYMFKISTSGDGNNTEMKIMYAGDNAGLSCFTIMRDGKRAACCYNSGTVRFWDLKGGQALTSLANCHEAEIICVELNHDGNLMATGGTDMKLRLINTNTVKMVSTLDCTPYTSPKKDGESAADEENDEEDSIESISFSHHLALMACATLSGHILVWDTNTESLRCRFSNPCGYSKLVWTASSDERLYAASLLGHLQVFDGRNLAEARPSLYCHRRAEILDFHLDMAHSLVFTVSSDGFIKIFSINNSSTPLQSS